MRAARALAWVCTGVLACAALPARAARPAAPPDPRLVQEMAEFAARYAEAVAGFRRAANDVVRAQYQRRMDAIRARYGAQIDITESEEKSRRMDAIAMFEAFLKKYPNDRRWTPDAMFRLAELYYEKSSEEFLSAQEAFQKALEGPNPPEGTPPIPDYNPTVALYRRLVAEFPNYRFIDAALYLLGFSLGEMAQEDEAKQALLALTCANHYRALDPPPPPAPASGVTVAGMQRTLKDVYADCKPIKADSKFLPEGWTRVGEMHFDAAELEQAISAYGKVLAFTDSSYYDKALYKLAWSYYRDNRFPEAIKGFDDLVKWADARKAAGADFGSDLRPEAIQYLGVSFSEPDWDGDTLPDPETGLQRARRFYAGREAEPHVREVFQKLGDIYFDTTKFIEAIEIYKEILAKWPYNPDAPTVQDKIVRAYERDRNMVAAAKEREALGRNYTKDSEWYRQNQGNPEALAVAEQLSEDALLSAATMVHAAAQACRGRVDAKQATLSQCKEMYATAAELYEKYLDAYPGSKRAYEFSAFYADALYYSGQIDRAIVAYQAVRDSELDNKYQEDSAFRIIKAYEDLIEAEKAAGRLTEPPLPDESNTKAPVVPIPMPELVARYLGAIDWYTGNLQTEKVADLRYAAAVLVLRHRNWAEARGRLGEIAKLFCGKSDMGFKAYDAILKTYFIDFGVQDEKEKDCALGRLLKVAEDFEESACGKAAGAAQYLTRINQIKASVKSTVITKTVQLAIENEDQGTSKTLAKCEQGGGGIEMVTAGAKSKSTAVSGAGPAEIDVGLALDLIDLVNANPKDQDAAVNLNNACVIYERLYQFGEATKCYERLARDYPNDKLARDAIWNAARNHRRFFNFEEAVKLYVQVAQDPKFADFEHRRDALGIAAQLLDNDQQYKRAADMYVRFSKVAENPGDAAQAYAMACKALGKANDIAGQNKCLRDFINLYKNQAEAGPYVVDGYLQLAVIAEKSNDKNATLAAYKRVRDEFVARKLQPATPAAAAAAKAEYLMLEEKFQSFKKKKLSFSNPKKMQELFDAMTAEAKSLRDEYARIWEYKDANYTLASFLRRGDIFYEFAQKLIYNAENPPDEIKALEKKFCRANPDDCGMVEGQYKDGVFAYVTPIEDEAKVQWRSTLERAAQLGVTNQYVKKARENLSKYLPDEFPFVKDERIGLENP